MGAGEGRAGPTQLLQGLPGEPVLSSKSKGEPPRAFSRAVMALKFTKITPATGRGRIAGCKRRYREIKI